MIILVQINYSEDHSEKILPLGILSVGSALKKYNYEVELINITEKEINKTAQEIVNKNPKYVALSVMTGIQTQHSAELSKKIKSLKEDLPIIWGGIHPSLLPDQCIKEDYIDYLIIGEGEETVVEFTQALERKSDLNNILGLAYKQGNQLKVNSRRPLIQDLDKWRLDFTLLDIERYFYKLGKYKRVIAYKTSRGCPFSCAFCYNNDFNQGRWRTWSEDAVLEDINYLKNNLQIDAVKFYDDNFFVDQKRAFRILKAIDLPSHIEIRIDFINDDIARQLKELKVFDMLIGLESGSDRLLQLIDKRFSLERMIDGVKSIAKYDLHASYSFIVGLPTETKKEFQKTIDLMYEIYKIHPKAGFTLGAYLPYPGSKMYEFSKQQGFEPPKRTEDWGKIDRFRKNFKSPWIDAKKVWIIRECYKLMSLDFILFKKWFEFRIKYNFYLWPIDIYLIEFLAGIAIEEKNWVGRIMRRAYNFLRFKNNKQTNYMSSSIEDGDIGYNRGKLISGIIYPEFFPINKEDEVLNIGCGDGVQAVVYQGNFKKMVGVDINQARLDMAEQLTERHSIKNFFGVCANVEKIPLQEKFDKIIAIDSIEHVVHPSLLISESRRLLKDNGLLLVTFPAMHDKWENLFRFIGRKILRRKGKTIRLPGWDPDEHQYDYNLKQWLGLMKKNNFNLVDSRASTLFPPLHYLGLPKFWFSNRLIHAIDNFLCKLPFFKNYGQSLVCVFKKQLDNK